MDVRRKRTVVCHFFNEEYLLPWWLAHHARVFDHGIMIDYASTDASRDLIRTLCPTWEIHPSRNRYFDSAIIDREVEDFEATCVSWRMALNVTEFLYGNVAQLDAVTDPTQHFVGNYVFVDPLDGSVPTHAKPLHEQITFGYFEDDPHATAKLDQGKRASRSIHNHSIAYAPQGGRHWKQKPTLNDVAIFFYGFAILNEAGLKRKLQIKGRLSEAERAMVGERHPNTVGQKQLLKNINKHHRPRCSDMTAAIGRLAPFQGYTVAPAVAVRRPRGWRVWLSGLLGRLEPLGLLRPLGRSKWRSRQDSNLRPRR